MKVTAPLVIAKTPEGADVYLYEGARLPELREGEVDRLKELGLVGDEESEPEGDDKPKRASRASK